VPAPAMPPSEAHHTDRDKCECRWLWDWLCVERTCSCDVRGLCAATHVIDVKLYPSDVCVCSDTECIEVYRDSKEFEAKDRIPTGVDARKVGVR
jgi:hypothetical protein